MEPVTPESKNAVTKTMAIIGFVSVIVFGVWLAVQIVTIIPSAFSSLASIADGVYNNRPETEFTVFTENTLVNADETFNISWSNLNTDSVGTYQFSYACVSGVTIDVIDTDGKANTVDCGIPLSLADEIFSLSLSISSLNRRFVDVPYTVTFADTGVDTGDTETLYEANGTVTVINVDIPTSADIASDIEENEDDNAEVTPTEDDTPAVAAIQQPTIIEEEILAIPISDPNGFTDLLVTYLAVGTLNSNNVFTLAGTLSRNDRGAFQFEVKNIGTKTSTDWDFEATLPNGVVFESQTQVELKPNELAVITIGFDEVGEAGTSRFGATVSGGDDINNNNNGFTWAVIVN